MRKKLQLVATFGLLACSFQGFSQQRFLNNVFTSVTKTPNVIYSNNISILTQAPVPTDLYMDVYEPTGDTMSARPMVLVLHTGSFLPAVYNGQPTGGKSDSAVVEMCMNFAKKGYVAVAAGYRMGWNPISPNQDIRTKTLLQAVYRAILDAKACVRYFKKDAATTDTYQIDTNRIAVGGLGSGGYVALAYGSLNDTADLQLGKFLDNSQTPPVPYIDQTVYGNFDGTNTTALNLANHAGHTSTVQMVFNVGGAIGDTSWIDAGEPPIVSLQCTKDPNAPYTTATVIVPSTGDPVVEASGSYDVVRVANKTAIDNNAIFNNSIFNDAFTTAANMQNDGLEGLYPFITPAPSGVANCTGPGTNAYTEQGAPWDWWDEVAYAAAPGHPQGAPGSVMVCLAKTGNPDMSAAKGKAYIDTIQGYVAPRLVCALNLPGCTPNPAGINEKNATSLVNIFPNPATSEIHFASKSNTIQTVELVDITGRMVKQVVGLTTNDYTVQLTGLNSGLYFAKVKLNKGGVITKRIVVQ